MTTIPEDIMQAARETLREALRDKGCGVAIQMSMHTTSKAAFETSIARAILAERERCAEVAFAQTHDHPELLGNWNDACQHIATAIRGGSHE